MGEPAGDAVGEPGGDAQDEPGLTIHLSPSGDDASDGTARPVKSLKRALGIAATRTEVTTIEVAAGTYSAENGETFPYSIPQNLTIIGPSGGGAIFQGNRAQSGFVLDTSTLENLEFESFTSAISSNGPGQLNNIRVRASTTALTGETAAKLVVDNLDITGPIGECATGIELNGAADIVITDLTTRSLGATLRAKDEATSRLIRANITGEPTCTATSVLVISSNTSFNLSDSVINGGRDGIDFSDAAPPTQATLTNVTIRNIAANAMKGGTATVHMTGGELSQNGERGVSTTGGSWTFTDVAIKQNSFHGIQLKDATLTMRGCSIVGSVTGIFVMASTSVDLGTRTSSGNNTISNTTLGIQLSGATHATAVGNTWRPNVQGTDSTGRYSSLVLVPGPVPLQQGNNYSIVSDQSSLER